MTKNIIQSIIDSRIAQRFIIFIAAYNLYQTWSSIKEERKIIIKIINDNNDFYKALATLNFQAQDKCVFTTTMEYDSTLTTNEINDIAHKTIISVIMKFVQDENLLGILHIDCDIDKESVTIIMSPVSHRLMKIDLFDFFVSTLTTIFLTFITYYIFT